MGFQPYFDQDPIIKPGEDLNGIVGVKLFITPPQLTIVPIHWKLELSATGGQSGKAAMHKHMWKIIPDTVHSQLLRFFLKLF